MIVQCGKTGLLDFTNLGSDGQGTYLIDSDAKLLQQDKGALMRRFLCEDRRPLTITQDDETAEINDERTDEMIHSSVKDCPFKGWECLYYFGEEYC